MPYANDVNNDLFLNRMIFNAMANSTHRTRAEGWVPRDVSRIRCAQTFDHSRRLKPAARGRAKIFLALDCLRWLNPVVGLVCLAVLVVWGPGASSVAAADTLASDVAGVTQAVPGGVLEALLFYLVAGTTVISSLGVCIAKNIVRMAVWLFMALGSVALLYLLLAANFLGAIQLLVYSGGTLVLLIFGIMLTSKSPWVRFEPHRLELLGAAVICGALLVGLCAALTGTTWHGMEEVMPGTSVAALGRRLLTVYLVPFEVAGVLLMIVMVGAAHLARQEK